jgi:hypothetical protein
MSSAFKPLMPNRSGFSHRLPPLGQPRPVGNQNRGNLRALPTAARPANLRPDLRSRQLPLPPSQIRQRPAGRSTVRQLPSTQPLPQWLRALVQGQKISILLALGLGISALTVYGLTFYAQHLWGQEYQKLDSLRRNNRQMSAYIGVMKNEIATQAEQSRGTLVRKSPETLIFVKPAPRPADPPPAKSPKPTIKSIPPVGY